jgi:hypothetical protein
LTNTVLMMDGHWKEDIMFAMLHTLLPHMADVLHVLLAFTADAMED